MTSVQGERQEKKLQWLGAGSKFTLTCLTLLIQKIDLEIHSGKPENPFG